MKYNILILLIFNKYHVYEYENITEKFHRIIHTIDLQDTILSPLTPISIRPRRTLLNRSQSNLTYILIEF